MADNGKVEIKRSARRRKSVSARVRPDGVLEILAPAALSAAELDHAVSELRTKLARRQARAAALQSDEALTARAHALNEELFGGALRWRSVRYVSNQARRWGSCTPADGTIRLSDRLRTLPVWVRDYVLVHEMAHLLEANHSPAFWALCARYGLAERARGYLLALDHTAGEEDAEAW